MPITRTCRISRKEFTISDFEIALLDKISPVIGGEKFPLPLPTLCPEERAKRRMQWKNYFFLWKDTCADTGEPIVSTFPPDKGFTVYSQASWWKKDWQKENTGRDVSFDRLFSEQFYSLVKSLPQASLDNAYLELVNSEYINGNGWSKDCYLISNGNTNERCLYAWTIFYTTNILNSNYIRNSENCSFSNHVWKCYNVHYAFDVSECRDSRYIFSCEGSHHLLGCIGLNNVRYQILNTPCTEDEWNSTLEKLRYDEIFKKNFEGKFMELLSRVGVKDNITTGSHNSSGDFCYDSKNAYECYGVGDIEDCAYCYDLSNAKDSMDVNQWGENLSCTYQAIAVGRDISNTYFSASMWEGCHNTFYSFQCQNCSNIFGCYGLANKSYCIFNKQYSKEEWEKRVKEIIKYMKQTGEWGEFWDPRYAIFPYDSSYAMTRFPITKEIALEKGYMWSNYESKPEGITKTIPAEKLPYDIREIPDDVLNWAIICKKTGKPYKIQPIELDMHRRFGIPLPKTHPLERIGKLFDWDKRQFSFDF